MFLIILNYFLAHKFFGTSLSPSSGISNTSVLFSLISLDIYSGEHNRNRQKKTNLDMVQGFDPSPGRLFKVKMRGTLATPSSRHDQAPMYRQDKAHA